MASLPSRLALALTLTLGCVSPTRPSFDETAALFHDDLRWGRLPAAEGSVDSSLREAFTQHHRNWGRRVNIVDLELDGARVNGTRGSARLQVSWVRGNDSTMIRETIVEEHWELRAAGWRLTDEAIVSGDTELFAALEANAPGDAAVASDASAPASR
ncbi:MAG: hypothetical protein JNK72_17120 [Myxococcales bacterium]|nr:hypothetical protein [Myxococcales bacterium]